MKTVTGDKATKSTEDTVKETAQKMRDHFAQTGTYRSDDVRRVFGDPGQSITGQIVEEQAVCGRKEK